MDLLTGGLILGGIVVAAKAFRGGSKAAPKTTTTTSDVNCMDAAKDCAALITCAGPILAKATSADIAVLTKMMKKADLLGCSSLSTQIFEKIGTLGKDVTTPPPPDVSTGGYSIVHGVGAISVVGDGDMIVVCLADDKSNQKYLTTLIFSNPSDPIGTYEKTLAELALDKFKKEVAKSGTDPTFILGPFFTTGAPADLKNGASFRVVFASFAGMGDVIGVVTKEQMKSSTLIASNTASPMYKVTSFAGEEDFLAPDSAFGSGFGVSRRNLGSNFGGRSRFGNTMKIGG